MLESSLVMTRFSVADLPGDSRYEVWKESISVIFDVDWSAASSAAGFQAEVVSAHLGHLMLAHTSSLGQGFDRSASLIHRDGIDHCLVQVYLQGETRGLWGSRDHSVVRPGDVLFLDAAQTVKSHASDFANLTVLIPRALLVPYLKVPERFHGRILPRESASGHLLGAHLRMVWSLLGGLPASQSNVIGAGLVDLVGRYFGSTRCDIDLDEQPATALALREVIRSHIEQSLEAPISELDPEALAARFGLSRSALYGLFKPLGGVSRYIWHRRLMKARINLLAANPAQRRITDIAFQFGFKDASHFSRAFRDKFGHSPSDAFEARSLVTGNTLPDGVGPDRSYEQWVRNLG